MAATRGPHDPWLIIWQRFLSRLDREAGVKRSAVGDVSGLQRVGRIMQSRS